MATSISPPAEPVSKPALIVYPNLGDVSEGQDLTLDCTVTRGTPPINFTWYHTETEGALASQTSLGPKGSHRINGVRGEHSGGYYCVSDNQANEIKRSYTVMIGGVFSLHLLVAPLASQ